jgi:Flp pilus assembly pilin Flp
MMKMKYLKNNNKLTKLNEKGASTVEYALVIFMTVAIVGVAIQIMGAGSDVFFKDTVAKLSEFLGSGSSHQSKDSTTDDSLPAVDESNVSGSESRGTDSGDQDMSSSMERKETLNKTIDDVLDDDDVQPGYPDANGNTNTTWCNRAAHRVLEDMGYDTSSILNLNPYSKEPDIRWTTANAMAVNASNASQDPNSGVKEISEFIAKGSAYVGWTVLAVQYNPNGHGHIGIVAPTDVPPSKNDKIMISQAGAAVGTFPLEDAFLNNGEGTRYYLLPEKDNG